MMCKLVGRGRQFETGRGRPDRQLLYDEPHQVLLAAADRRCIWPSIRSIGRLPRSDREKHRVGVARDDSSRCCLLADLPLVEQERGVLLEYTAMLGFEFRP